MLRSHVVEKSQQLLHVLHSVTENLVSFIQIVTEFFKIYSVDVKIVVEKLLKITSCKEYIGILMKI